MNIKQLAVLILLSCATAIVAKAEKPDPTYAVKYISPELKKNAHTVIRDYKETFQVINLKNTINRVKMTVTLLNKNSDEDVINMYYDKLSRVKWIKGAIYDANGKLVKKIKKKDLIDRSAVSSFSIYEDNRAKSYRSTYSKYPYTISYEYETTYFTTMFYPDWYIQPGYGISVEKSFFEVLLYSTQELRYKVKNIDLKIKEQMVKGKRVYRGLVYNLKALKREPYAPKGEAIFPMVKTAPNQFKLGEYNGNMSSWASLGKFNYDLNKGRDVLSPEMTAKVKELTKEATTREEKIEILYKYMQENMRYVSVQLGIGGWQTFDAKYVEKNKYGDCKALTNFMKSMLKTVEIPAHPALIKNGRNKADQDKDFSSRSFNHVILYVPGEKEGDNPVWLECTSSDNPVGYIGRSNHNRYALVYSEEGGELIRTPQHGEEDNQLNSKVTVNVSENGSANIKTEQTATGYQQDYFRYASFNMSQEELEKDMRQSISLPTFKINALKLAPSEKSPEVKVNFDLSVKKYATKAGKRLFLRPNVINRISSIPTKVTERKHKVVSTYAYLDNDEVTINIPKGYKVESIPNKTFELESPFGRYEVEIVEQDNQLIYKRKMLKKAFDFPKEKYKELRAFYKKIAKVDKMKIVLVKEGA